MNPYAAAARLRRRLYAAGVLRSDRAPGPCISVGNLTFGGTGKTPVVEWMARRYLDRGRRVAILSRGYGRRSRGLQVVSDGEKTCVDAARFGDEPVLLATNVSGAVVIVAKRRLEAARKAAELGANLFLLDDGFQHLALRRDVDVVLLDADDPFGGGCPPFGRSREGPEALTRADVILFTRCRSAPAPGESQVFNAGIRARVFHCRFRLAGFRTGTNERLGPRAFSGSRVVAFCAIGKPESFRQTLEDAGMTIAAWFSYRDHHRFEERELARIDRAAGENGASLLVTTEKDRVRIPESFRQRVVTAQIELEFLESDFGDTIDRCLAEHGHVS